MSHRIWSVRLWCGCYLCGRQGRSPEVHGTTDPIHATRYQRADAERIAQMHPGAAAVTHTEAKAHPWAKLQERSR